MTRPPLPEWCEAAPDAAFIAPTDCARRAGQFERRIRIRNGIEYAAGVLVIALFGSGAIGAGTRSEWIIALALALVVAGTLVIMRNLHRRAGNLDRLPEESCLMHLRRQYARQQAALKSVPAWYIGPLIPGVTLLYGAVTARVAEVAGWRVAIEGIAGPAAITFGSFGAIALINLFGARSFGRKIEALDALA